MFGGVACEEGVGDGDYRGYAVHDLVGESAAHFHPCIDVGSFEL